MASVSGSPTVSPTAAATCGAAEPPALDRLPRGPPGAAGVADEDRQEHARDDDAGQHAAEGALVEQPNGYRRDHRHAADGRGGADVDAAGVVGACPALHETGDRPQLRHASDVDRADADHRLVGREHRQRHRATWRAQAPEMSASNIYNMAIRYLSRYTGRRVSRYGGRRPSPDHPTVPEPAKAHAASKRRMVSAVANRQPRGRMTSDPLAAVSLTAKKHLLARIGNDR